MNRKESKFSRDTRTENFYNEIYENLIGMKDKTAHCLVELGIRQYQRMSDNMIVLSELKCTNGVEYHHVQYGRNVSTYKKKRVMLVNQFSDVIDLSKVKHNYFVIVTKSEEIKKFFPNLMILKMSSLYQHCPQSKATSGYLLLCIATSKGIHSNMSNIRWNNEDFMHLKRCKKNVIKKNHNHHQSTGHYFNFGNKAGFFIENNLSVGLYSTRKAHSSYDQSHIDYISNILEQKCYSELNIAQQSLCKLIPLNDLFVMPIITAIHEGMAQSNYKSPLTKTKSTQSGCWNSSICVNAETQILHSEEDCTYTIIYAPRQKGIMTTYEFNFNFNDRHNLSLSLNSGVSFMFSGLCLKHKQCKFNLHDNELFYNFSSYGNKRLLNHLKQTLDRIINTKCKE